jgi:squalene-associated FAD-dependent desaturase
MDKPAQTVAVIGGGLAGMAAAVAAVERGMTVELFEQAKTLGGRAASFVDSETGQSIDYGQHVAMGCCSSLLDFCRRTGVEDCFERHRRLHFIAPDGSRCDFAPSAWLPAPLHLLPGLMRLSYLSWSERWGIVRALRRLARQQSGEDRFSPLPLGEGPGVRAAGHTRDQSSPRGPHPNPLPEGEGTIGAWLRRNGQSQPAIEHFWSVVLVSALSETVDHASFAAARKVFCDGFLASRTASDLLLPRLPLGEIFHTRLGEWLSQHGVAVHLGTRVRLIEAAINLTRSVRSTEGGNSLTRSVRSTILADGTRRQFDFVIVAVPWRSVRALLAEELQAAMPALRDLEDIQPAAITAVHLWFDRPITRLPHAVLVGRLGQWVFTNAPRLRSWGEPPGTAVPGRCQDIEPNKHGHYCQVVISASHRLADRTADEWLAAVCRELREIWPAAREARLLHGRVVTQPSAAFSMQPGIERLRPPQQTPLENLFLAGDWTSTGWPATMEGAVRSGCLAVDSLLRLIG